MIDDRLLRADFKEKIAPHLDVLLQFSLWLTKNGRDATRLMRGAMAEAFLTWDEFSTEASYVRLHSILKNHFLSRSLQSRRSPVCAIDNAGHEGAESSEKHFSLASLSSDQKSWITGRSGERVSYLEAFAGLPPMLRSTMILSYLEGFSNTEIADLSGVEPRIVESTLSRGREFMREQLFAYLMGERKTNTPDFREAITG